MAKNQDERKKGISGTGDAIAAFIENHRKKIIAAAVTVVVVVLAAAAGAGLREWFARRGIKTVEALAERYDAVRFTISDPAEKEEVDRLLADLAAAGKSSGYAGARAWHLAASIHADRTNWEEAETAWNTAAKKAGKTYLAPAALFNAAAAAEERGRMDAAIENYTQASLRADFPQAPRALFSAGRLEEGRGNSTEAIETYRQVVEKWPATDWAKLAQSRIITLSGIN
ncbi:MAG: tetratricopeptide repeat protein [Spirochaetaceae bacterium]|jgi:tetratricopeptide (TPR) repeat protein|nr:tetratricopeptide repeat protein [Spirochaetaceae bacterium]